jgi:small conductance mechanosensitive channel
MNDTVRIGEQTGHVQALNFRTTHIKTFDEKDVFIPNAKIIKESVVNLTRDGIIRLDFLIGIAYEDDSEKALELIIATIASVEGVMTDKNPFAVVEEMATNTMNIRCYFWSETDDYKKGVLITKSKVVSTVKQALTEAGFTLPANVLELKMYDKRVDLPVSITRVLNS